MVINDITQKEQVKVCIDETPFQNAKRYHENRRKLADKTQKTINARSFVSS